MRGEPTGPVEKTGKTNRTGTRTTFKPDPEVFTKPVFAFDVLAARLRELAYLNRGITIELKEEATDRKLVFHYTGGLSAFVEYLNENKQPLFRKPVAVERSREDIQVEVALQYNDGYQENIFSFVNNITTIEGGTHLVGFKAALTRTINNYATQEQPLEERRLSDSGGGYA